MDYALQVVKFGTKKAQVAGISAQNAEIHGRKGEKASGKPVFASLSILQVPVFGIAQTGQTYCIKLYAGPVVMSHAESLPEVKTGWKTHIKDYPDVDMSLSIWLLMALGLIAVALLICICAQAWSQRLSATRLKTARDDLVTEINRYNADRAA